MVIKGEVHHVAGHQQGLYQKCLGKLCMCQHASNLLHKHHDHPLSYPIVLWGLGGSCLMYDSLSLEEAPELLRKLAPVVSLHGLQLSPDLLLDLGEKLLEHFKDLILFAKGIQPYLAGCIVDESDKVPVLAW